MEKVKHKVLKAGTRVGPCEVVELIGHGGMGTVYRATHTGLGKMVALKVLASPWSERQDCVEGFLREARLASRLEDEHIVQIYDLGTENGIHYIVMQLAKGQSLRDRLKESRLEAAKALEVVEKAARALRVAHDEGIVHRDIKPHNIILTDDDSGLKILDFGLARFEQSLCEPEQIGEIVGSLAYIAPEQSDYVAVDARADIYSLGVTAFQCLTGSLPFSATTEGGHFELIARHHWEVPVAPSLLNAAVPLTVSRVVLKMMEKLPEHRYQNAGEVLEELRLLRRHSLPVAPPPWKTRPLNPPTLAGGEACAGIFRNALTAQRDRFLANAPQTPLAALRAGFTLAEEKPDKALAPEDIVRLTPRSGGDSLALRDALARAGEYGYRERFLITIDAGKRLAGVHLTGSGALEAVEAQYLYDLLESIPAWGKRLTLSLAPDYLVQAQDVRWVVDAFNIAGVNKCGLTLVVGSSRNHDTFVRLGLDRHISLELELEQVAVARPPAAERSSSAPLDQDDRPELERLSPTARTLVDAVARHVKHREYRNALELFQQLQREAGEAASVIAPLRKMLYDQLHEQAEAALKLDDMREAGECSNMLVDLDPGRYEGYYGKAMVFKKEGKLDYAVAFLSQAILAAPDVSDLFYHRAIIRSRGGDPQGALRDLTMAIEHNPRNAAAYFNRSLLHKQEGRTDQARQDMHIAKRLNPDLRKNRRLRKRVESP